MPAGGSPDEVDIIDRQHSVLVSADSLVIENEYDI